MNITGSSAGVSSLANNLFNKLDAKQKGYIEQSDMQSALSSINGSGNNTDVSEAFSQLDADSDGKITKSELSNGLQTLADALFTQFQQARAHGADDTQGPPPPRDDAQADEGFTQDQLSTMAADSSTDSKRASLMSKLADNFAAADTDGNGKISRKEAMAYEKSTRTDAATACNGGTDADSTASGSSDTLNLKAMVQIMQLLQAYGASSGTAASVSNNTLTASA